MNSAERAGLRPKDNVPTLRFPEFDGEWHHTTIGDCCSPLEYGMNAPAKEYDGANKYIRITDIDEDTCTYKCDDVVSPNAQLEDKYRVRKNDILFARTGASTGKAYLYNEEDGLMYYAGFLIRGNVKPAYNAKFVFLQTQTQKYKKWVDIMSIRSGQPGINSQEYSGFKFHLPPSKVEQDKISTLFTLLDERITTQIRIIKELKLYRNTLVFRLLTPKDKWLRLSIGDVAHVIGGGTPDTNIEDYWNGSIQWFTPSEIGKEKYVTESERTLTQKGLDNSSAKLLPPGTILLSTRATIGECSIAKQECCTNQGFQSLIAKKVTPEFLYYLIQTKKKDLLSKASGSTFAEISANEVRKIHICIPGTQEEQKAIVQPLSAYDEKIETECKILHLYELQKQFLLGQMFI